MSKSALRLKYLPLTHKARHQTVSTLGPLLGTAFSLSEWSNRAFEALWDPTAFPWEDIARRYADPDRLEIAVWVGDRLVAMGLCTTLGEAVMVQFIEGDYDTGSPLKGKRALVVLDVATNYAQLRGKRELRLHPINPQLVNLYESVYEFTAVKNRNEAPYWCKKV